MFMSQNYYSHISGRHISLLSRREFCKYPPVSVQHSPSKEEKVEVCPPRWAQVHLVLHPVEPRPDSHRLDLPPPVHTLVVGARFPQGLIQTSLKLLQQTELSPHLSPLCSIPWSSSSCWDVPESTAQSHPSRRKVFLPASNVTTSIISVQLSVFDSNLLELPSGHKVLDLPN